MRAFLDENRASLGNRRDYDQAFSRKMAERGWIGMTWPKQYGGHERTAFERYVVIEEMLAAGAPVGFHWTADRQSGPNILRYGTDEQKDYFLPRIARGDLSFCIGMSEPDSGSDLAGTRTRAVKVDGGFRINGSKLWTSNAHRADYMILFCKMADAGQEEVDRHAGATQFLVDLKNSPGIEIRPVINLIGEHHFNQTLPHRPVRARQPAVRRDRQRLAPGVERTRIRAQWTRSVPGAVQAADRDGARRRSQSRTAPRRRRSGGWCRSLPRCGGCRCRSPACCRKACSR